MLRALEAAGIHPDVVCGTSIGAVVGAAYAAGSLDAFENWVTRLGRRQVATYLDIGFRGGILRARKVFEAMAAEIADRPIESLPRAFAAVATDLATEYTCCALGEAKTLPIAAPCARPGPTRKWGTSRC